MGRGLTKTFSLFSNFIIYINCEKDSDECFEDNTEHLFKMLILATFVMNFIVFQDYLAKKWKKRDTVKSTITSMSDNTSPKCSPVDLAKIESHIRYITTLNTVKF